MGISYKAVVRLRLMPEKCIRDIQRVSLKVVRWDLRGENEGIKGVKIGIMSKRKNSSTSEKGRTKHTRQCQVLQGMGNSMREMKNLSNCAN